MYYAIERIEKKKDFRWKNTSDLSIIATSDLQCEKELLLFTVAQSQKCWKYSRLYKHRVSKYGPLFVINDV
jgi:hypothetical protein